MNKHSGSYARRGDALRRRKRYNRGFLFAGFAVAAVAMAGQRVFQSASAESLHTASVASPTPAPAKAATLPFLTRTLSVEQQLDDARGQLDLVRAELERAKRVMSFSARYGIAADLAGDILDISLAEGIDPELGFRLVKLESDFKERATSPVGAVGLTQVMPATAKYFVKGVTRERLYDRETNLRVGFRYLRTLVGQYKGDVKLALLVYNRGPAAVEAALRQGVNPTNGYDRILTKGYKGTGTVD